jgi:hypothetical protein
MKISADRARLLLELEGLIGRECYNANIQNWGPGGEFEGEGRDFRYPITFIDQQGKKLKKKRIDTPMTVETAMTGHYSFGANQLHIIRALDNVLAYLEKNNNLKV